MKIHYAPFHRWYKEAIAEPADLYSKKNKKRILSTIPRLDENGVVVTIAPLEESFLGWFISMYEKTISSRQNAQIHDVRATTIDNATSPSTYFSLTITQNNEIIGGVIFGEREDRLMTVYKVLEPKWQSGSMQANPTLVSEYLLSKRAFELGKDLVSHGKDRNPYGINAAIGLATFKLSTGYQPLISLAHDDYQKCIIDTTEIEVDALIFHYPESGEEISKATLVTTPNDEEKYKQLLSYNNTISFEVVFRN